MKHDDASYHCGKGATDAHSFAHIGLWFRWCLIAGLVSDEHTEDPELKRALDRVRSGSLTGAEYLLQHTSGKLADNDLTEEGSRFTKHAYMRSYLSELRGLTGKPDYAVTEGEVDFAALKQRLDALFEAWKAGSNRRPWWQFWGR
ncbi:MAG: hypothetical protein WCC53_05875 [Thermoanaerobaculia bacterium]